MKALIKMFFKSKKPTSFNVNTTKKLRIKKSSEYIDFEANQEEIAALQAEIAQLRTDLLDAQKQVVELQTVF